MPHRQSFCWLQTMGCSQYGCKVATRRTQYKDIFLQALCLLALCSVPRDNFQQSVDTRSCLQLAILVCCEVLPTTLMTLPAAQGGLTLSFQIYADHIRDWGFAVPAVGPAGVALGLTALLAAFASLLEHTVTEEEFVSHLASCLLATPWMQCVYWWCCGRAYLHAEVFLMYFAAWYCHLMLWC